MVTGFDYLSHDKTLQEHWLRRVVALLIDGVVIYIPASIFMSLIGFAWLGLIVISIESILFFFYCSLFDYYIGGTLGKMLLRLKAVAITGKMNLAQALMRNVTKVVPPLLVIDWVIGMAIDTNDPRQKWTDQLARTSVMLY